MLPTMSFMTRLLEKSRYNVVRRILHSLPIAILIFIIGSCAKDPGQIGYIIQPEDSKLNVAFNDTSSVYAYSKLIDSIRSDNLSVNALGSLRDPIFGSTTSGFYTQFGLSIPGKDFGEGLVLDSLVLQLIYEGYYGDTNATYYAHTYELLEEIKGDSIYYSNIQLPLGSVDYSNHSFIPNLHDSIVINEDTIPPVLRINLSDLSTELGYKLLLAGEAEMESTEAFQEFFGGLFVQSQPVYEDGGFLYFNLSTANSKLTLYYKNDTTTETQEYNYILTSSTARINKYEHDYNSASSEFKAQLLNGDTATGQQKFYVQGFGGAQSIIKFPYIRDWAKNDNVAINEAKLVLPGYDGDGFFGAPAQMSLLSIDDDGKGQALPDYYEGDIYFDGFYNDDNNTYEFRITRYIQSLISDTTKANNGLYMFMHGGSSNPERFIFKGNDMGTDSTGIKLEILFTDL